MSVAERPERSFEPTCQMTARPGRMTSEMIDIIQWRAGVNGRKEDCPSRICSGATTELLKHRQLRFLEDEQIFTGLGEAMGAERAYG